MNAVVNGFDLVILQTNWGPCPGYCGQTQMQTFSEFRDSRGITEEQWNAFIDVVLTGTEQESERWRCWMERYLTQCQTCRPCRGSDPFAE